MTARSLAKRALLEVGPVRRVFEQRDAALAELERARSELANATRRCEELSSAIVAAETRLAEQADANAAAAEQRLAEQANTYTELEQAKARSEQLSATLVSVETRLAEYEAQKASAVAPNFDQLRHLEHRGLFVVGHARSGTTILTDALNESPDVFLLGEANLHQTGTRSRFAEWYNGMHTSFRNPWTKTTYCPPLAGAEASGVECLDALSQRYRYVGEKVAFRSKRLGYDLDGFFSFQAKYFLGSHYICVIRNPKDTLKSNILMFNPSDASDYSLSYIQTLLLCIDIYRTFPNTSLLLHERISKATFASIERKLEIKLQYSYNYYDPENQKSTQDEAEFEAPFIEELWSFYNRIKHIFCAETLRTESLLELRRLHYDLKRGVAQIEEQIAHNVEMNRKTTRTDISEFA